MQQPCHYRIEQARLAAKGNTDTTKEVRASLRQEASHVMFDIENIEDEKLRMIQRIQQYRLLLKRTKEDRDRAEQRMLLSREVSARAQEDIKDLRTFSKQQKTVQEDLERNLGYEVSSLDSQRVIWKSSLKMKAKQVYRAINQRQQAKQKQALQKQIELQEEQLKKDKLRNSQQIKDSLRIKEEEARLKDRLGALKARWNYVCAGAGVEAESPVEAVERAWKGALSYILWLLGYSY